VTGRAAEANLSIEIGSDPIAGSLSVGADAPRQFSGWIELVAAIESLRHDPPGGVDETLGLVPGADGSRI
jgi:hypothetical protein